MSFNRKKAILAAARYSFENFGYKATTMGQVAKVAKVGKGTIYTFFKNKDELFFEITKELLAEMKETAEAVIQPDASFIENTNSVLYALLALRNTSRLTVKLIHEANDFGTPAVIHTVEQIDDMVTSIIKEKLQIAIGKGKIKPCNVEITSFIIIKLYSALLFEWQEKHGPLSKEEIATIFQDYLVQGLLIDDNNSRQNTH